MASLVSFFKKMSRCYNPNALTYDEDDGDAGDDLDNVVNDDGVFQFERLTIAHKPRPQVFHSVNVTRADDQSRPRRSHQ